MRPGPGWRPLGEPARPAVTTPPAFVALARTHALMVAGDTLVATALAGSLFFSISPDAARTSVARYLILTMAPFAVMAPLIGPAIDRRRGGRRLMVVLSAAIRAVLCLVMIDDLESLLLFPEVLTVLVLAKGYSVARSALVPASVRSHEELVGANSRLTLIGGLVGFVAAVPAIALLQIGPGWVLGLAAAVFAVGAVQALRLPTASAGPEPEDAVDRAELRGAGVVLAATAMALLRAVVGFMTFLIAFALRNGGAPAWWFGLVIAASGVGTLVGAGVAPALRRWTREERILVGALVWVVLLALSSARLGGRESAALLAGGVGAAAGVAKLAFDSIVQRDAPDADQARSFARFETRFQLAWVAAAFVPVLISIPLTVGYLLVAGAAGFAAVTYTTGQAAVRRDPTRPPPPLPGTRLVGKATSRLPRWTRLRSHRDAAGRAGRHPHPSGDESPPT